MPRDGSGNYVPPNGSWTTGVNNDVDATIADWTALLNDISNAISQSMSKDGQTSFTNHIQFGTKRATNLGDPVSEQDAVTLSYMTSYVASASVAYAASAEDSTNLGGHPSSWYQQALEYTPLNKAGDSTTGDLYVTRSDTGSPSTGGIFLGNSGTNYLDFDGSYYNMPNNDLIVNGGTVLRSNNIKSLGPWSIIGSGALPTVFAFISYNATSNTINNSYNVASVTDNGTGSFTINFLTACSSANYAVSGMCNKGSSYPVPVSFMAANQSSVPTVKSTTACRLYTASVNTADNPMDCYENDIIFVI